MDEEVFDVIMQSTGEFRTDVVTFQQNRPPDRNLFLDNDLWLGRLPNDVRSNLVFDACGSAGFNFHPILQYGMRYAFCRKIQPGREDYYQWDSDGILRKIVFLSRLIRPTTIATALSARLYFEEGELKTIVPGPRQVPGSYVWVIAKNDWRDWLSEVEAESLRLLWSKYDFNASKRIKQARKHIDHAFHTFYLDQRCASLVTGFESLLKVSDYRSTKQFVSKALKLAEMLDRPLKSSEAEELYENRSAFVHGSQVNFDDVDDVTIRKYNSFESVLRLALLKASTEPEFAELFSSAEMIERTFGLHSSQLLLPFPSPTDDSSPSEESASDQGM